MNRKFVDIDLSFKRHPITGDIGTKNDIDAIKTSIRNLIKTMPYDRKYHPEISCRIKNILFRDVSTLTILSLKEMITEVISNHEPRVTIESVQVQLDNTLTHYHVVVYFKINNIINPISVTTLLSRIR